MKYVIVEKDGFPVAVLMPDVVPHVSVQQANRDWRVVSAGFCEVSAGGQVRAFGRSDGFGLEARAEDARVIADSLFLMRMDANHRGTETQRGKG